MDEAQEIDWVGARLPTEAYDPGPDGDDSKMMTTSSGPMRMTAGMATCKTSMGRGWIQTASPTGLQMMMAGRTLRGQSKELEQSYMAFKNKANFLQSRRFTKAKGGSRGFYPLPMMKGKKGKGKGKKGGGKKGGKVPTSSSSLAKPLFAAQGGTEVFNRGRFICGDHGRGFRNWPKRGLPSPGGKRQQNKSFWVDALTSSPLNLAGPG